jgi:hypothetical protein
MTKEVERMMFDVYHADRPRRQVMRVESPIANMLLFKEVAEERKTQKHAIVIRSGFALGLVWAFIWMMRHAEKSKTTSIDSKTTKNLGRNNYKHIRTNTYSYEARRLTKDPTDERAWKAYSNLERAS